MDDGQLSSRLLDILGSSSKRVCSLHDILRGVGRGYTKKDVNRCLYGLKRQRKVVKVQESPPEWSLVGGGQSSRRSYGVDRGQHRPRSRGGFGRGGRASPVGRSFHSSLAPKPLTSAPQNDLESMIVQFLHHRPPCDALDIAKGCGLQTTHDVNPTLYEMEKKRRIQRFSFRYGSPKWRLVPSYHSDSGGQTVPDALPPHTSFHNLPEQAVSTPTRGAHIPQGNNSGIDLTQKIIALLSNKGTHSIIAKDISDDLALTCAEVNNCLYSLEKEGVVQSHRGSGPPTWTLSNHSPQMSPTKPTLGRGMGLYKRVIENRKGSITNRLEGMSLSETIQSKLPLHPLVIPSQDTNQSNTSNLSTPGGLGSSSQLPSMGTSPQFFGMGTDQQSELAKTQHLGGSAGFDASVVGDLNRNPVSLLSEYCQANKYQLEFDVVHEYGLPHQKTFVMEASFNGLQFQSQCTNKKDAKRMVAEKALQYLRVNKLIGQSPTSSLTVGQQGSSSQINIQGDSFECRIASLAHEHHAILESTSPIPQPGRKVIACFILEDTSSMDQSDLCVVAFGSGTRCINGEHLSMKGDVVNDSHAEVIARRGLMRYFYSELAKLYRKEISIFEKHEGQTMACIKQQYQFHLYISTAPCGDGAQFSRDDNNNREPTSDGTHKPTMSNKQQGLLRTKMEGGEGTIPIAEAQQQTWDGIMQGERLRTMSCSDKIAQWNVVGLQGALLSHFMFPVYMSSLTLGSLHHHGHLSRAVCCRLDGISETLQMPFQLYHPSLGRITGGDEMKRHTEKTTHFSMNWAKDDEYPEVTNGTTGRPVNSTASILPMNDDQATPNIVSRVCKAKLFLNFVSLCKEIGWQESLEDVTYCEAKMKSVNFQEAKEMLFKICLERGFGLWMKKPQEQSQFTVKDLKELGLKLYE